MNRRRFIQSSVAVVIAAASRPYGYTPEEGSIMTVTGPIPVAGAGRALPHEHVLVDFIGADQVSPARYDREAVFTAVLPFLKQAYALGHRSLFECTPAFLGRDPLLLRRLSEATGLAMVTNTGYYGARNDTCLPAHAFTESAEQLAGRWIREWKEGIEGTGIRPGFIKIGVDDGPLSEIDGKLVRAAALTHLETGLTIAAHTGPAQAAFEEIEILRTAGVRPEAWIWVHAQAELDFERHRAAAEAGAWISFDGLAPDNVDAYVERIRNMHRAGLLDHVLVSHDAGWYHVGEPDGGDFRPYDTLANRLVPALKKAGLSDKEIETLTIRNPARAYTVRVRKG